MAVIESILAHLKNKAPSAESAMLPKNRAPPRQARLGDPVSSIEPRNTLISVAGSRTVLAMVVDDFPANDRSWHKRPAD
jgi:hypothetical protein